MALLGDSNTPDQQDASRQGMRQLAAHRKRTGTYGAPASSCPHTPKPFARPKTIALPNTRAEPKARGCPFRGLTPASNRPEMTMPGFGHRARPHTCQS